MNDTVHTATITAPRLRTSLFAAAPQLLVWLLWHPSTWHDEVQRVAPQLAPTFCLAELHRAQFKDANFRRLLWLGYGVTPLLFAGVSIVVLSLLGLFSTEVLIGLAFAYGASLLIGAATNAAAGMVVASLGMVVFAAAWRGADLYMVDMVTGVRYALMFGSISAIVVHVTGNIARDTQERSYVRQVGGVVIGLVVSVLILALLSGLLLALISGRQAAAFEGHLVVWIVGGFPGVLTGIAIWQRTRRVGRGLVTALVVGLIVAAVFGDVGSEYDRQPGGRQLLLSFTAVPISIYLTLLILPYALIQRLVGPWPGAVAGVIGSLAVFPVVGAVITTFRLDENLVVALLIIVLGLAAPLWHSIFAYPFLAAWNTLIYQLDLRRTGPPRYLHYHAAFWDELVRVPQGGLDDYLVLAYERDPILGRAAQDFVSTTRQRWAAQTAQIELDARRFACCKTVEQMAQAHSMFGRDLLEGPASPIYHVFQKTSMDVATALKLGSAYNQRLALTAAAGDLNNLLLELTRTNSPFGDRFRPVVAQWRDTITTEAEALVKQAELRQEIQNPYVVGVPLTTRQEIFVGRTDVARRIEGLFREQDHPPILLYGQRRMGKTSLLFQLKWMLPHRIAPLVIDLQGPVALATNHAGFLYNLAKGIRLSAEKQEIQIEQLARLALTDDPFTVFDDWLDTVEVAAVAQGRSTLLLALDEFESLDQAMRDGRLEEEAILGTIRHIVQHRPRFKLLIAGSHTLAEFQRWAGYLINAQTVHLGYLEPYAAHQLVEHPIADFALVYTSEASVHTLALTRRHPYLIQLLCAEIVMLKNLQQPAVRRLATIEDVEIAASETLQRGQQFFADIEYNQIPAEAIELLRFLAAPGSENRRTRAHLSLQFGEACDLETLLVKLTQRELIEEVDGQWQFQVELIRRWFTDSQRTR